LLFDGQVIGTEYGGGMCHPVDYEALNRGLLNTLRHLKILVDNVAVIETLADMEATGRQGSGSGTRIILHEGSRESSAFLVEFLCTTWLSSLACPHSGSYVGGDLNTMPTSCCLWETAVEPGDTVAAGGLLGRLHNLERPSDPATPVVAPPPAGVDTSSETYVMGVRPLL
jgi:hypothetical protein